MTGWRPSLFLLTTALLHLAALPLLAMGLWGWALGWLVTLHLLIMAVSLWPRSQWLGPNMLRLPATAARRREVAITIDDGPDPVVTPQVLRILAAHGAKATFFCIGERAARHPELCRSILAAGHTIENHGQTHHMLCSLFGPARWRREVGDAQATLLGITGRRPIYYRAMAGLRNPFLAPVLHALGLQLVTWTRRGYDSRDGNADQVLARLLRQLAAGDILLLHDGHCARTRQGQPVILAVLPRLLEHLSAHHLQAVTLADACATP
ncbi:polysaccharide deacetylase family protein [Rhodoferax sp. GW822-FHT02A01]|uniref:polysaccharide deacetylase family protein n=1 Tax=Rhodoferax sp. GW822-FHT02A01 TaxID=3141537 RepID=UPI00315C6A99